MTSKTDTTSGADKQHWANIREAGTLYGFHILLWIQKIFGRGIFSLALYPVMVYFLLVNGVARRASLDFLRTHYQAEPSFWRRPPGYRDVFRHFISFGQSVLDKLLAWSISMSEEDFLIGDQEALEDLLNDERGQLIIGTHLGNLEYCRGFMLRYKQKVINVLLYDQHAANFVKMMQHVNPDSRVNVYQVDQLDIPTVLSLKTKIEQGEWLFIAGDRVPLSGELRTLDVNLLERRAPLPIGPYMLAKTLQCPVKLMFSYRVPGKVYFDVVPFAEQVTLPRKGRDEALQAYAQSFASELDKQCRRAPLQWFNFYPFWADSEGRTVRPTETGNKTGNSAL